MKRIFSRGLWVFIFIFQSGLFAAPAAKPANAPQTSKNTNASDKWYTNANVVSEIPFSELEKKGIYFFERFFLTHADAALPVTNAQALIESLIVSSNLSILKALAEKFGLSTNFSHSNIPSVESNLLKALYPDAKEAPSLVSRELIEQKLTGGAILRNSDSLESVEVTVGDKTEHMIHIRGAVEMLLEGNTVRASSITINSESRDLFATGRVTMEGNQINLVGERLLFNLSNQNGYLLNARGKFEGFHFTGEVFKINKPTYFSLDRGTLTVDTNEQPHFLVRMSHFDNFARESYIVRNLGFYVHNQPFFYFPYFFQDRFGTSVDFTFGNTQREGWYFLNAFGLSGIPLLGGMIFRANVFEKLGLYLGLENGNSFQFHNYSAKAAFAAYTENNYLGPSTFNTIFTGADAEKQYRYRYKVEYRHSFDLIPDPGLLGKLTSRLNFAMKEVSDPYFTHNLERSLPSTKLQTLLQNNSLNEGRYVQLPSDTRSYVADYSLGIPGLGINLSTAWSFANFEDKSIQDITDNRRWVSYLQTVEAPYIKVNAAGAIDPPGTNAAKKFSLNLGYNLSASYRLTGFYDTLPPFSFSYHDNYLQASGGLTRSIVLDKDSKGDYFKGLDLSLTPSIRAGFDKYWGGENRVDVSARNLRDSRIYFGFATGFVMNFPSTHVKNLWNNSPGFESMLPTATLSMNYNLEKDDNLGGATPAAPSFKHFRTHSAGANFSLQQKGYGLFFIPYLDLIHGFTSDFSLDLLPVLTPDGFEKNTPFGLERINAWNANYGLGLVYRSLARFDMTIPISFYNRSQTNFKLESRSKNFSLGFGFVNSNTGPAMFRINQFTVSAGYAVFDEVSTYNQDRLNFDLEFRMGFLKFFDFSIKTSSVNPNAYRYFPDKAAPYGQVPVDLFADLSDSLGITDLIQTISTGKASIAGLQRGLFKLSRVEVSLIHDLDSWFMELRYDIAPRILEATGALKGYYFEQNVSFQINLKPEFRVKGLDATLDPWKHQFSPPELRDFSPPGK